MKFSPPLQQATFKRRYKRFLADICLDSGEIVTAHCPNTGAMSNCLVENSPCWFSHSNNPKRKLARTWELATTRYGHLAGIHSRLANTLVKEALNANTIREITGYTSLTAEVPWGEKSRLDFMLQAPGKADCIIEVKSVTLGLEDGTGLFPDAVSTRGTRHLQALSSIAMTGKRAVLFFCVQHSGIQQVSPAATIDPKYTKALQEAAAQGVEILAYRCHISPEEITLNQALPVSW